MFAFREILHSRRDELAALITDEHGKVLSRRGRRGAAGIEVVEYACGVGTLLRSGFAENVSTGVDSYASASRSAWSASSRRSTSRPWCRCVPADRGRGRQRRVLKPSEKDPSAAVKMAEWFHEAGLPEGVFNVVHGDKEAVDALLDHPDVKSISSSARRPSRGTSTSAARPPASGSRPSVGQEPHGRPPGRDIDLTADAAVSAGFGSAGERCMAISVVVAVGDVADRLIPAITDRMAKIRTGDGREPGNDMGPLVSRVHRDKVAGYIDEGVAAGAEIVVDGRDIHAGSGFFLGPTLFDRVAPDMSIYTDEIFGRCCRSSGWTPTRTRSPWSTPTGTATARRSSPTTAAPPALPARGGGRMIGVNVPIPVPMAYFSFGGWKASLFGDTHAHGVEGVHFFTRGKVSRAAGSTRRTAGQPRLPDTSVSGPGRFA